MKREMYSPDIYQPMLWPMAMIHMHHIPPRLNQYYPRFRRSVSLKDTSVDINLESSQKISNVSMQNESLNSSVNHLCIRLRPYQLLPEFHKNIIRTANEHEFDWLKLAADILPVIEKRILNQNLPNQFEDDEQMILFAKIATDIQIKHNLISAGFRT